MKYSVFVKAQYLDIHRKLDVKSFESFFFSLKK